MAMAASVKTRNKKGQFKKTPKQTQLDVLTDHNYVSGHICQPGGCDACVPGIEKLINSKKIQHRFVEIRSKGGGMAGVCSKTTTVWLL